MRMTVEVTDSCCASALLSRLLRDEQPRVCMLPRLRNAYVTKSFTTLRDSGLIWQQSAPKWSHLRCNSLSMERLERIAMVACRPMLARSMDKIDGPSPPGSI